MILWLKFIQYRHRLVIVILAQYNKKIGRSTYKFRLVYMVSLSNFNKVSTVLYSVFNMPKQYCNMFWQSEIPLHYNIKFKIVVKENSNCFSNNSFTPVVILTENSSYEKIQLSTPQIASEMILGYFLWAHIECMWWKIFFQDCWGSHKNHIF
jgi:hypothetical protein